VKRAVGDPVRKIQIEILAVGREHERPIADFPKVEPNRVGLIQANDLAKVSPVQTIVGGCGESEGRVQCIIRKFGVIGRQQVPAPVISAGTWYTGPPPM